MKDVSAAARLLDNRTLRSTARACLSAVVTSLRPRRRMGVHAVVGAPETVMPIPPIELALNDEKRRVRARYTPAAARLADALLMAALKAQGREYRLPDGLLPEWLMKVLDHGARLDPPEMGWPEIGRIDHPIDWPALIEAHPQVLAWHEGDLLGNDGASPESITAAYRLLVERGCRPYLDVALEVGPHGHILVAPSWLRAATDVLDNEAANQVDEMLTAGGRPEEWLVGGGNWALAG
ncbi:hypothetical protein [Nocardia paucivorans]|uniref:hypothetical protein n=1 Tax=Nocardia paucivorans TaxID=114259 RepID=UPI00030BB855|nr:hypothetical protein [Nocardia paucivorans]